MSRKVNLKSVICPVCESRNVQRTGARLTNEWECISCHHAWILEKA